ncbi:CRISPR-associated protein (Cas_Csd1) [Aquisphaera giovannonii]|uniref:CRISPR-associated protein (Cas_Csd1) n=1 Tax=Aquisphaera giovannonii TaxID=406548 RepID=A0A5B9VU49_9BACT|nr:type I-C CRISPR-associated protein Cas8c/Csd1 [Aquisphaera giovannonii]QEH32076.1 CRISPR-associated protein (Cas_Csd1) [Aquisphaera giovannonii]
MSTLQSGLLPALVRYYERLERDPGQNVAGFGFSIEKVSFCVVLELDGSLSSFADIRDRGEKGKATPRRILVPDGGGRSGIGLKPFFCWDNTGYALGRDNKGKPERAAQMFEAFRELHRSFLHELQDDEGFVALCRFLETWEPAGAESLDDWDEAAGLNVAFRLRNRDSYVHDSEAVRSCWSAHLARQMGGESGPRGISLVSGEEDELARLHPQIGGVSGANTTGAAIVSFNLNAFESYGKSQSYNAPVGERDAFRYSTALNRLLADQARKVRIGDATVVFWSDSAEGGEAEAVFRDIFGDDQGMGNEAEHAATVSRLKVFLDAARQGRLADALRDPDAPFYVLGLSPNQSRLNVRYWLVGTVRRFAERLSEHVGRLDVIGARPDDPPLSIRRLLWETAREPKAIAPQLAGEVARAVLGGLPYPQALFQAVIRRVRADSVLNHRRAAILKAYLIRNENEEVSVALNKDHPDQAYHLGRLFAALEKVQEESADSKLNSTVKDRFFGSAAATPAAIFPRLLRLHQHHLNKMSSDGLRITREKLVGEISGRLDRFPSHLPLEKQGLFYLGYYHQRQDFFTKRPDTNPEANNG